MLNVLHTINMKYQYPYIRNYKSIKQGYIGCSKIQKETWIPWNGVTCDKPTLSSIELFDGEHESRV